MQMPDEFSTACKAKNKNNRTVWVDYICNAIRDDNGQLLYYMEAIKDISDRKIAEEELAYRNKELDTLIYRSSHDLRGPIVTILGLAYIARWETDVANLKEYLENCRSVALKMDKVLLELLSVTRIRQNKVEATRSCPVNLVDEAVNRCIFNKSIDRKNVTINADRELKFTTDLSLLQTAVEPLIENALVYSKEDTEQHRVSISIFRKEDSLEVMVKDNGIGISEEEIGSVFDFFYRGKNTGKGSGIGMYLAKSAVRKLNGTIDIQSQPGVGTEVRISIPELMESHTS